MLVSGCQLQTTVRVESQAEFYVMTPEMRCFTELLPLRSQKGHSERSLQETNRRHVWRALPGARAFDRLTLALRACFDESPAPSPYSRGVPGFGSRLFVCRPFRTQIPLPPAVCGRPAFGLPALPVSLAILGILSPRPSQGVGKTSPMAGCGLPMSIEMTYKSFPVRSLYASK